MEQTSAMAAGLEARLSQLERRQRRTNRVAFCLGALMVAGVTMGMRQEEEAAVKGLVQDRVQAKEFILVRDDGRQVGRWASHPKSVTFSLQYPDTSAKDGKDLSSAFYISVAEGKGHLEGTCDQSRPPSFDVPLSGVDSEPFIASRILLDWDRSGAEILSQAWQPYGPTGKFSMEIGEEEATIHLDGYREATRPWTASPVELE